MCECEGVENPEAFLVCAAARLPSLLLLFPISERFLRESYDRCLGFSFVSLGCGCCGSSSSLIIIRDGCGDCDCE